MIVETFPVKFPSRIDTEQKSGNRKRQAKIRFAAVQQKGGDTVKKAGLYLEGGVGCKLEVNDGQYLWREIRRGETECLKERQDYS